MRCMLAVVALGLALAMSAPAQELRADIHANKTRPEARYGASLGYDLHIGKLLHLDARLDFRGGLPPESKSRAFSGRLRLSLG